MNLKYNLTNALIPPNKIFLDITNPRFSGEKTAPKFNQLTPIDNPRAQELCRRYLLRKFGGNALAESIRRMGFLKLDRIVVRKISPDKYVAIEGNRRLAAIKTLLWDDYRRAARLPSTIKKTMDIIEVLVLDAPPEASNASALLLQGVRHISGVRNWGPYQQGKLIKTLVDEEGMNFTETALAVGLSPGRVSTLLRGYCGLQQLMEHSVYGDKTDASYFSFFEQAYLKIPVRNWLEWDDKERKYVNDSALSIFYRKIMPQDSKSSSSMLARDVRDLLPAVLENAKAKKAFLQDDATIQEAFALTNIANNQIDPFLKSASSLIKNFKINNPRDIEAKYLDIIKEIHSITGNLLQHKATN